MENFIDAASALANRAVNLVNEQYPTLTDRWKWECAFHHATDLILFHKGERFTTRCLKSYEPNELEEVVEALLKEKYGIVRNGRK